MEASTTFYDWDDEQSKKVSLKRLLAWCKKNIPSKAKDICIKIDNNQEYHYETGELLSCYPNLELHWKQIVSNKNYDKDMKKYHKSIAKWKKQCQK